METPHCDSANGRGAKVRIITSLIAASPWLLLQALNMRNASSVAIALTYGGICYAVFLLFVALIVSGIVERRYRIRTDQPQAFPAFTAVACLSMLAVFMPGYAVHPIVMQVPQFCSARQSVAWSTTLRDQEGRHRLRFNLVLLGAGTNDNYRLDSGFMNWSGNEDAGLSSIRLNPIRFNVSAHLPGTLGSYEYVRDRMSNAGLDRAELDAISRDVWQVLETADRGDPISATHGDVSSVKHFADDGWVAFIGGIIWMVLVIAVFQYVGYKTLSWEPEPIHV